MSDFKGKFAKEVDAAYRAVDAPQPPAARLRERRRGNKSATPERVRTGNGQQPPQLIQSSAQFVKDFVPPDYLIDGLLQRGFIYSLTGKTGSGKTAIALLVVASVAHEEVETVGGREVEHGRGLYFAGENPDDIRMRWIAMGQHLDFDPNEIEVYFIPGRFKISEMAARIEQEVKAHGPFALVVVDTSAAYFEGDNENDNVQQGIHAHRMRVKLTGLPGKPTVIVNCHPTKNAADDNLIPRGGGSFIAEVDGNLTAANRDNAAEMHWQGKFRGPDFAPMSFQLKTVTHERLKDRKGRLVPTVIAAYLSDAAQEEIAAAARVKENEVLAILAAEPNASLADIAKRLGWFIKRGTPQQAPNKMAAKRAVESLRRAKLITLERGKPVLTAKGTKLAVDVTVPHVTERE